MTTNARATPAEASVLSSVRPVPHDFGYRICTVCQVPIPPDELVDDDYRPRHEACNPGRPTTVLWQSPE